MLTLTTMDLRKNLGHILDTVSEQNEQVVISRANKPIAVIVSVAEFEAKVQRKNRVERLKALADSMDLWRGHHERETGTLDAVSVIRECRNER